MSTKEKEYTLDFVIEKYVSIIINDGNGKSFEKKYFENDKNLEDRKQYYFLTSNYNQPDSPDRRSL